MSRRILRYRAPIISLSLAVSACDLTGPAVERVALVVQPQAPAPSGAAFAVQPVIQLVDGRGRPVSNPGVLVTASIAMSPGGPATISHETTGTDNAGIATFMALAITGPVGEYRLSFSGDGLVADTSTGIFVTEPISGFAVDAVGDFDRIGADLSTATLTVVGGDSLLICVRWAEGHFIRDTSRVSISLDMDQDPMTGHPGINATGTVDGDLIGSELVVKVGATQDNVSGDVRLLRYAGSVNSFTQSTMNNTVTYFRDGMDVTLPLFSGSAYSGPFNFKAKSSLKVSASGYSGWLDVMPDVGEPPTTVGPTGTPSPN